MLPVPRSIPRYFTTDTYVCLQCRLQTQRRQLHDGFYENTRQLQSQKRRRLVVDQVGAISKQKASKPALTDNGLRSRVRFRRSDTLEQRLSTSINSTVSKGEGRGEGGGIDGGIGDGRGKGIALVDRLHQRNKGFRRSSQVANPGLQGRRGRMRRHNASSHSLLEETPTPRSASRFSIQKRVSPLARHRLSTTTTRYTDPDHFQAAALGLNGIIDRHLAADKCYHAAHWPVSIPPSSARGFAWQQSVLTPANAQNSSIARQYHTSSRTSYANAVTAEVADEYQFPPLSKDVPRDLTENPHGIRAQLRRWQELHGHEDPLKDLIQLQDDDVADPGELTNNLTRLSSETSIDRRSTQDEEEKEAFAHFADAAGDQLDGSACQDSKFLHMGDLVEIAFQNERESVLGVYVRDLTASANEGQYFTMQGRWMHLPNKVAQYSVPGWASPKLVEPLLDHLPPPEVDSNLAGLREKSYMEDLSVPRDIAAPLVKRLLDFYQESQEIYRRHAHVLDNAHDILSHDTDLRYGSLISAATTLLKIPSDKVPLTALFTVRKALTNGGFGFNIDRRSHRTTGYMQIRSKDQVRMVEQVRDWMRQWQEDLAFKAGKDMYELRKHKTSAGAQTVYNFLEKARAIVLKNRENRQPTESYNVGPSKVRLPWNNGGQVVRIDVDVQFTQDEMEIVRFLEAWCCSQMFDGLPSLLSLPPLLLQATGLYKVECIVHATGFMFLQEMGTILPYENRVRFDQHLLLPSSQHSKPLQNLMSSLLDMKDNHNFHDAMAALRHDWKDLPVYCIDKAGAHEIDDGISIEAAGTGADGSQQHWVHVHIANPTAFFSRDHPLAKMARHMGESIYMPERTYMMLPKWCTQNHFSLGPNRPCLTISAKLDSQGKTLEHKITPGTVRNTISLTPKEVQGLLGSSSRSASPTELILSVGGDVPYSTHKHSRSQTLQERNINDLRNLEKLALRRADIRKRAGGVFFNQDHPDVTVWQNARSPGLAWDHPHRSGSRTVEGDPIIEMRTPGLLNWFAAEASTGDALVREHMLLACEVAAFWCAERQIPIIYRGTLHNPSSPDPKRVKRELVDPVTRPDGSYPMIVGLEYIRSIGSTILRTKPRKHDMLGMQYYSKVTSPLRRYGDMILHWQIEAALRHEAETGKSLIAAPNEQVDRSFLPFSTSILETIMLGLMPRESMIMRAKQSALRFWQCMLLFRKHYFGEDGGLPFKGPGFLSEGSNDVRPMHAYIITVPDVPSAIRCHIMELNMTALLNRPVGLDTPRKGDIWEVEMKEINVYVRSVTLNAVRLIGRDGAGML